MAREGIGQKNVAHQIKMSIATSVVRNAKDPARASYAEMARYAGSQFSATPDGSTIVCRFNGQGVRIDGTHIKAEIRKLLRSRRPCAMAAAR